jgi:hypothetical protein
LSGTGKKLGSDQRLILILMAMMLVLIIGMSVLSPQQDADSPTPASDNTGPLGTKAAYLTLEGLGHKASQWKKPLNELNDSLSDEQVANTTVVLLEPKYDATQMAELKQQVASFLSRGGRLLTTGADGARLVGGKTENPELLQSLCHTTPDGNSALSRAGKVEISDHAAWKVDDKEFAGADLDVTQYCDKDAAVVQFGSGKGSVVWWTAETPMTNLELKQDPALKLVLASVGEGRDVVFDEALHEITRTKWDATKGLPILWVSLQTIALMVLLVLSFSRRRGPVRMPVVLPRSSPVEFATSMGDLYEKGHATSAVTEAARRRLQRVLTRDVGLPQETIKAGPEAIAEALKTRLGSAYAALAEDVAGHLREANEAMHAKVSQKSTLTLARALSEDAEKILAVVAPVKTYVDAVEFAGTKE